MTHLSAVVIPCGYKERIVGGGNLDSVFKVPLLFSF